MANESDLQLFQTIVDSLAELRDKGSILVFVRRTGEVRFIQTSETTGTLHQILLNRLPGTEAPTIYKAFVDVSRVVSAILYTSSDEDAARSVRGPFPDTLTDGGGSKETTEKVRYAKKLVTDAVRQRAARLMSACLPCLADIDAELVSEREDNLINQQVETPFLRIRLRYDDFNAKHWAIPSFFFIPDAPPRFFELECDLSDLDLLAQRIQSARQLLLDAIPKEEKDASSTT